MAKPTAPRLTGIKAIRSHKEQAMQGKTESYGSVSPEGDFPPCDVSQTTETEIDALKRRALPQPARINTPSPQPIQEKDTTLKIDPELKGVLESMKTDPDEPLKGVIRRLVEGKTPMESTQDTRHIEIPEKVYRLLMMMLPDNMKEVIRKGIK
jgi:hypothetical protein